MNFSSGQTKLASLFYTGVYIKRYYPCRQKTVMLSINISLILQVMLVKYNNTKIKVKPWESGKGLHVLTLPDPTGPMTASSLPCKKQPPQLQVT